MAELRPIVLLVDEQKIVHHIVTAMLTQAPDIELHHCYDSDKAVAMAEHIGPTVILQDLQMAGISGMELLQEYRNHMAIAEVPVLMLSATTAPETKAEAFARGADDYLEKMPHPIEMIARIRHHSRAYTDHLERAAALLALENERQKLAEANHALELLSSLDGLTGLANRRYFDTAFDREWQRAMRETEPISLFMIDVDYFKNYNDHYGHQAGDECLKHVAKALSDVLQRPADIVARYGGEEFIALLPGTHSRGVLQMAEVMRKSVVALQIPHMHSPIAAVVTVSIGLATVLPMLKHEPTELIAAADQALYAAKRDGRNRVIGNGF